MLKYYLQDDENYGSKDSCFQYVPHMRVGLSFSWIGWTTFVPFATTNNHSIAISMFLKRCLNCNADFCNSIKWYGVRIESNKYSICETSNLWIIITPISRLVSKNIKTTHQYSLQHKTKKHMSQRHRKQSQWCRREKPALK